MTTDCDRDLRAIDDEIIRYGLLTAAEEAAIAVVKAACSQFIVEGSDAGTAILTRDGRLVAQASATSILHSGGIAETVRSILEDFPADTMSEGDVYIVNDPYRGGVHANDVTIARPVFIDGCVEFFAATLIHVLDLGGAAHGGINAQATETLEEGLQIPPLHLERAGVRNEGLVKLIGLNSRSPIETIGDIDALASGALVCSRRVQALVAEHGLDRVQRAVADYLADTQAWTRSEIALLPNGIYEGASVIDDDGVHQDRSYEIKVRIAIKDGIIELDFEGSSDQVRASVNSSASQAFDAAVFGVRCFLDKAIPTNDGVFRSISARFPRGSLLNPDPPHPCGGRMMAAYAVVDAIVAALSAAIPERRVAGSGILVGYAIAGMGASYWIHNSYDFGGTGARDGHDGSDATGFHFGVGRNQIPQIEPVESRCGLLCELVELIVDSGGPGRWRGGLGVRTAFRALEDVVVSIRTDHFLSPPSGVSGGGDARPSAVYILDELGGRRDLPSKAANVRVSAGGLFVIETSGGGGCGSPLERATEDLVRDVLDGRVSRKSARDDYGVTVSVDGIVDPTQTRRLREP
jgi:N-methylhydantoinase B